MPGDLGVWRWDTHAADKMRMHTHTVTHYCYNNYYYYIYYIGRVFPGYACDFSWPLLSSHFCVLAAIAPSDRYPWFNQRKLLQRAQSSTESHFFKEGIRKTVTNGWFQKDDNIAIDWEHQEELSERSSKQR